MSAHVIRVYDFENTDLDPPAEVIEVGLCDLIQHDKGWAVQKPVSWLCGSQQPMSPGARSAHHIRPSEIEGAPPFVAAAIWERATVEGVSAVAAHNSDHEAKFWGDPTLPVICTYKAALRVWPDAPSHSNGSLRYWLEDQGLTAPDHGLTMPPHRAGPDAYVTAWTLAALLTKVTAAEMVRWTKEPRLLPNCPIGKFRGQPWPNVEQGFLQWMLRTPDLEPDFVWNARQEIIRREKAVA